MNSKTFTTTTLNLVFILFLSIGFAQEKKTENYSDKLYEVYKAHGVEKTLTNYNKSSVRGDEYTFLSEPLNVLGYRIMGEGDLTAAEKVFLAQIDEYPNEANPYDSYADLLMKKGDEENAKINYSKAIDLSATMEDLEEKQLMLEASKSKLAKLQNKGMAMNFLAGTWTTQNYAIQDGERVLSNEGNAVFTVNEDNTLVTGVIRDKENVYQGSRLIAYNAVDEVYDMVYISNGLTGIEPSTIRIDKITSEEIILTEKFKESGKKIKIKHVLKRTPNEISWDIHDISEGQATNLVSHMNFKKNN
ncbi:tetratricopeptide repeat protein [Christiangramia salexigens]|uniref:Uncharacterized protein n=1 Tax=Christiangramia salexigens TaxID=1913577 RepID=A0A1L3J4G8_9FLAO|nr:hypothetical protein [Christiangramia salexigens]APG60027.1 hypothetical protein LPB144_06170 [Christiangramia salexigens]